MRHERNPSSPMRGLARDDAGAVVILVAALLVVLMWCVAFAIDAGSLYFERRKTQGAADLAAMAAARDIARAEAAIEATLAANGIGDAHALAVQRGSYSPDPALAPQARFVAGAQPANAVRVRLQRRVPLHFAGALLGVKEWELGVSATAATSEQAAFSIGTRLVELHGGMLNALLGALLGGELSLTAMDYRHLAEVHVKLFDTMDALASALDLTAVSYDEVLAAQASMGTVLRALAQAADAAGAGAAATAVQHLAAAAQPAPVPLDHLFDLGPYGGLALGGPHGFAPEVSVLNLVSAAASAANGGRQVEADLGLAVPGIANVKVDLAIGERPQGSAWLTVGDEGARVRTAQTRLRVGATVGGSGLLAGAALRVPLVLDLAEAEGRLDRLTCGADPRNDARVDTAARPGIARMWLGDTESGGWSDLSQTPAVGAADIVTADVLGLVRASIAGSAHAAATNLSESVLTFSWDDIDARRVKSTATHQPVTTLVSSLLGDLKLNVDLQALGLGLAPPGLAGQLSTLAGAILGAAAPALDQLLAGVLEGLGVALGAADIRVEGLRCNGAALVG